MTTQIENSKNEYKRIALELDLFNSLDELKSKVKKELHLNKFVWSDLFRAIDIYINTHFSNFTNEIKQIVED